MKNSLLTIIFLSWFGGVYAQQFEANSRPYRFYIDKILNFEGQSAPKAFTIKDNRKRIVAKLEEHIAKWYEVEGKKLNAKAFERGILEELERIQPFVIQEIGIEMLDRCQPSYYFIPEELKFEIYFNGFESIEISVPIAEVEDFKQNFNRLTYSDHEITYNEFDRFVINNLHLTDPQNEVTYSYQNPTPHEGGSTFEIRYPN